MPVKKVFTPVGVTFKGGGFYKTDSRGGVVQVGVLDAGEQRRRRGQGRIVDDHVVGLRVVDSTPAATPAARCVHVDQRAARRPSARLGRATDR